MKIRFLLCALGFLLAKPHPVFSNPTIELKQSGLSVTYTHSQIVEGTRIALPTAGFFNIDYSTRRVRVFSNIIVSLGDLQNKITGALAAKVNKSDDCGDVIRLQSVRMTTHGERSAQINANVNYERWLCTYADIPETRCEDTWIKLPFGGKTKGIPKCTVTMKTRRTSKNRVFETGVSGVLLLHPSVSGNNQIAVRAEVTDVRVRNDLVRFITQVMDVDLKRLAQGELEKALGNGGAIQSSIPVELQQYLKLTYPRFMVLDSGVIGFSSSGSATLTFSQAHALCTSYSALCR